MRLNISPMESNQFQFSICPAQLCMSCRDRRIFFATHTSLYVDEHTKAKMEGKKKFFYALVQPNFELNPWRAQQKVDINGIGSIAAVMR